MYVFFMASDEVIEPGEKRKSERIFEKSKK